MEVAYSPDDMLWVTERAAGRVARIDPETVETAELLTVDDVLVDPQQQGLLGMALHPELLRGGENNYLYLYQSYDSTPDDADEQDAPLAKVVRYTYTESSGSRGEPMELISGIPAGNGLTHHPAEVSPLPRSTQGGLNAER